MGSNLFIGLTKTDLSISQIYENILQNSRFILFFNDAFVVTVFRVRDNSENPFIFSLKIKY